jgi:hypothetical protein
MKSRPRSRRDLTTTPLHISFSGSMRSASHFLPAVVCAVATTMKSMSGIVLIRTAPLLACPGSLGAGNYRDITASTSSAWRGTIVRRGSGRGGWLPLRTSPQLWIRFCTGLCAGQGRNPQASEVSGRRTMTSISWAFEIIEKFTDTVSYSCVTFGVVIMPDPSRNCRGFGANIFTRQCHLSKTELRTKIIHLAWLTPP